MQKNDLIEFKKKMSNENTEYLIRIWNTEYPEVWGEEKINVVGEILTERGEQLSASEAILRIREEENRKQNQKVAVEEVKKIPLYTLSSIQPDLFEYLGIVSAEVVLGTGWFTELEGEVTDFLGQRSTAFQSKLEEARIAVIMDLRKKTYVMGGNVVLGVEFDYLSMQKNMLMVSANGTAARRIE